MCSPLIGTGMQHHNYHQNHVRRLFCLSTPIDLRDVNAKWIAAKPKTQRSLHCLLCFSSDSCLDFGLSWPQEGVESGEPVTGMPLDSQNEHCQWQLIFCILCRRCSQLKDCMVHG